VVTIAVLLLAAGVAGVLAFAALRRSPLIEAPDPAKRAAERLHVSRWRRFLDGRADPRAATGLALTLAVVVVIVAAGALTALVGMVRSNAGLVTYDRGVAVWGARESTATAAMILRAFTWVGSTIGVVAVAIVVAVLAFRRLRRISVVPYLVLVVGGQDLVANLIKLAVNRARPTVAQLVVPTGSSFPSGHTTAAAACYAAFALVLGIERGPRMRALLFAGAVAIAVAVGCSRVFLGVHWLTDVLGGLALGWGWFALISIVFGGRLLEFGEPRAREARRVDASDVPAHRSASTA
jgi:undecaprenyl-diphosphatase